MTRIVLKVTQEDIDQGTPENPRQCPVALALQRRYPALASTIRVDVETLHIGWETLYQSAAMQAFVEAFDSRQPVHPRTFRITFHRDPDPIA